MNTSTWTSIQRTMDPKFTTYRGDGTGRDTYIINSDGGFCPEPARKGLKEKEHFRPGVKVGKEFVY